MKLILFRHGLAVDREWALAQKMDDAKRPLTEKGREKTEKVARVLREWDESYDLIVTSPLLRAQQTTDILKSQLKVKRNAECSELVPSAPPEAFAQWLKGHAVNMTSVIAVGHEPQLSLFASWALTRQPVSFIELKKSGMICLEIESFERFAPGTAELSWLVSPKLLLK